VIGVIHLDGVEAAIDERRDQVVAPGDARMGERRHAAGRVNCLDHRRGIRSRARHECGPPGGQQLIERFLHRLHVTGAHQLARELRAAHGRTRPRGRGHHHLLDIDVLVQ
jgi:hypothetical protein